jgi:hypothetical protein
MRTRLIIITAILLLFSARLNAQLYLPLEKQYYNLFEKSIENNVKFHSAIKPFNIDEITVDTSQLYLGFKYLNFQNNQKIALYPIFNASYLKNNEANGSYSFGGGFGFKYHKNHKWYVQLNISDNYGSYISNIENKIDSNQIIPHFSKYITKSVKSYQVPEINGFFSFMPKSWLSLYVGYDKHFIGDGYRSLFLSDNSSAFPFAGLEVAIWYLKFKSLWASLTDIDSYSGNSAFQKKYMVMHYLSYNVSNRLNLGFFESIIWRASDSLQNRGFDLYYLNPLVFMRPVEFSLNSPDNANLGIALKLRLWKKTFFYGQLFLDDFIVSEFVANKGWWGNKYGIQLGLKCYNLLSVKNLYAQGEYNFVRPFTYAHSTSLTNFGNNYQALAHPLGANFHEVISILSYSKNKFLVKIQATAVVQGIDTSIVSYGSNIYKSYNLRNKPDGRNIYYGYNSLQGIRNYSFYPDLSLGYVVSSKWNMLLQTGIKGFYSKTQSNNTFDTYFYIGLKTCLSNFDTDF